MKGDFSRDTFDKTKHFSRVLMQQGRVQLDSDGNEQAAILLHYMRTLAADLIGPFAGPVGGQLGFAIGDGSSVEGDDFLIGKGRYYVDGILVENETAEVSYKNQKDFPNPPALDLTEDQKYLVYLDVWERLITAVEDDHIREKALSGPDTANRAKVVWQVKWCDTSLVENLKLAGSAEEMAGTIRNNWEKFIKLEQWQPAHLGCLKARVKRPDDSKDPCLTSPDAKYRGTENHLYRVEIHAGGDVGATFKWARENGAVMTGCKLEGVELTVNNPHGFAANQWVELTNDGQELRGEPGTLVKLINVENDVLTLESTSFPTKDIPNGEMWPTKVRRWDQTGKGELRLENGAMSVKEGAGESSWISLEDGIEIQFQRPPGKAGNYYRTGDYWLIPARVTTGNIEWPVRLNDNGEPERDEDGNTFPIAQPPHGIRHHYAPLAILTLNDRTWQAIDCRCRIKPANLCGMKSYGEDGMGGVASCGEELQRRPVSPKKGAPPSKKAQRK